MESTPAPSSTKPLHPALQGSCACGSVVYTSSTLPVAVAACHCIECRKASGAPFLPFGLYHNSALVWQSPKNALRIVHSSDIAVRGSCSLCGTPLFMRYHCRPDGTSVTLGTIDDASLLGKKLPPLNDHYFVAEKATWCGIYPEEPAAVILHRGFPESFQRRFLEWKAAGARLREDVECPDTGILLQPPN